MGSRRTKKLTVLERSILDDERLQPLSKEFGAIAVWHASVDVLGFPPWLLSTNDLLLILNYLKKEE
jgi:hypothetical protein